MDEVVLLVHGVVAVPMFTFGEVYILDEGLGIFPWHLACFFVFFHWAGETVTVFDPLISLEVLESF